MRRRQILSLCASLSGFTQTAERRPSIVILLAGDLGFSNVGCYGPEIETPHIDAPAAAGTRFSGFYNWANVPAI
jgi:arylsulfatase